MSVQIPAMEQLFGILNPQLETAYAGRNEIELKGAAKEWTDRVLNFYTSSVTEPAKLRWTQWVLNRFYHANKALKLITSRHPEEEESLDTKVAKALGAFSSEGAYFLKGVPQAIRAHLPDVPVYSYSDAIARTIDLYLDPTGIEHKHNLVNIGRSWKVSEDPISATRYLPNGSRLEIDPLSGVENLLSAIYTAIEREVVDASSEKPVLKGGFADSAGIAMALLGIGKGLEIIAKSKESGLDDLRREHALALAKEAYYNSGVAVSPYVVGKLGQLKDARAMRFVSVPEEMYSAFMQFLNEAKR